MAPDRPECKSLLGTECDGCFSPLLGGFPLTPKLVKCTGKQQGSTYAKGMIEFLSQRERLVALVQGLVWKAKNPFDSYAISCVMPRKSA